MPIQSHPHRYELSNELHARPFPQLSAPSQTAYFAIKRVEDAANRNRDEDRAHLIALLDRHGAAHPPEGASHYYGSIGRDMLKWECHTEFVTYTLFSQGVASVPFSPDSFARFPPDWLDGLPGTVISSAIVHMETGENGIGPLASHFVAESLAVSEVLDNAALVASDFRIDPNGHVRFAVLANPGTGSRRLGRIVQRLLEIETYKSMAMLTLPVARATNATTTAIEVELTDLIENMVKDLKDGDDTLSRLLKLSSELAHISSESAFRFGAAGAYAAIVAQRIELLREVRHQGRQTLSEFMIRRFDPAMRTCQSAQGRLAEITARAERAATLHRTRLEEARAAQNAELLASMDRRAEQQLRLQKTVEGLSVVAIGYYGVNLAGYLLAPFATELGLSKTLLTAILVPVVLLVVWRVIHRIRRDF